MELGTIHRRAGRRTEARRVLREGLDGAYRCGSRGLVARARDEHAAFGVRPPIGPSTGAASLTPTALRVHRLAAAGLSKQIAETVFVTPKTLEMHQGRIYRKLGIASPAPLFAALERPPDATAA